MTDDGVDGEVSLRQPNLVRCAVTDLQTHNNSIDFDSLRLP